MASIIFRTQLRHSSEALQFMLRKRFRRSNPESLFFYTLHKCASTLFSDYILNNLIGLKHVDYALDLYKGRLNLSSGKPLTFASHGYVYGPIRVSGMGSNDLIDRLLNAPTMSADFVSDKIALFFVRDPRDILVSAYHSFAYTHGYSAVPELRRRQEQNRAKILAMTVDEYALSRADNQVKHFTTIHQLAQACHRSVILKYEDMVDRFDHFSSQLTEYVDVDPHVLRQIQRRSRPRTQERENSHRRSGRTGGFRSKLKPDTVAALNQRLSGILDCFQYPV